MLFLNDVLNKITNWKGKQHVVINLIIIQSLFFSSAEYFIAKCSAGNWALMIHYNQNVVLNWQIGGKNKQIPLPHKQGQLCL